jgi:hypothetical protein
LRDYKGSTFVATHLTDISIDLSDRFAFIHPVSTIVHPARRGFTKGEWWGIVQHLKRHNLCGVVVGQKCCCPSSLINLTGRTTLLEAIELLKKSSMFIGISSCFSSLATKLLPKQNIKIKTVNKNMYKGQPKFFFFSPHRSFPFLYLDSMQLEPILHL